jgi:hypothetical protein
MKRRAGQPPGRAIMLIFGLFLILSGCNRASLTPEPKIADRSFLTGQPCKAPCWYNLELDKSTQVDVIQTIKELPFVDHNSIIVYNNVGVGNFINAAEFNYDCIEPKRACGSIVVSDDKLKMVDMIIQYSLTIKTVVDQIGSPDYVFFTPAAPEGIGCEIGLDYWPEKGITIISKIYQSNQACHDLKDGSFLDKNLNVTEIQYLTKDSMPANRCEGNNCIDWKDIK